MKVIVETTSAIMLIDSQTKEFLPEDRPAVMTWSQFMEARTGAGQIRVLANNLPDEANDADFLGFLKEAGSVDLAVASYMSTFEPEPEPEPAPAKKAPKAKTEA